MRIFQLFHIVNSILKVIELKNKCLSYRKNEYIVLKCLKFEILEIKQRKILGNMIQTSRKTMKKKLLKKKKKNEYIISMTGSNKVS